MAKNLYIDASHPSETRVVLKNNENIEDYEYESINYTLIKSNNITLNRLGHREYGDLIIIKIKKVLRANSKNEITTVDRFYPKTITIPVNISE